MMFRETTHIDLPVAVVDQRLRDRLAANRLQQETSAAVEDGATVIDRTGRASRLTRQVVVDYLLPVHIGSLIVFPIRWRAPGPLRTMVPTLDANIELTPTTDNTGTVLVFVGSYRPPLGRAGAAVDRALLHRVADATLHGYLRRLTAALTEPGP